MSEIQDERNELDEQEIKIIDPTTGESYSLVKDFKNDIDVTELNYTYNKNYASGVGYTNFYEVDEHSPMAINFQASLSNIDDQKSFKKFIRKFNKEYQLTYNYNGKLYNCYCTAIEDNGAPVGYDTGHEVYNLKFQTTSDFFSVKKITYELGGGGQEADNYPYSYPFTYGGGNSGTSSEWTFTISEVEGDRPAFVNVIIKGGYTDPGYEIGTDYIYQAEGVTTAPADNIKVTANSRELGITWNESTGDTTNIEQYRAFGVGLSPYAMIYPDEEVGVTMYNTEAASLEIVQRYIKPR